jgi:hypothetical protein
MPDREMSMVERVATAILKEQETNRSAFPDMRDLARAAIEAMREPTEAMKKTMANTPGRWGPHCWGQIVDAALKEHEG